MQVESSDISVIKYSSIKLTKALVKCPHGTVVILVARHVVINMDLGSQ